MGQAQGRHQRIMKFSNCALLFFIEFVKDIGNGAQRSFCLIQFFVHDLLNLCFQLFRINTQHINDRLQNAVRFNEIVDTLIDQRQFMVEHIDVGTANKAN